MIRRYQSPKIVSLPTFRHSSFETCVVYDRSDLLHVQLTLTHELHQVPELCLASYTMQGLTNAEPAHEITLSVAEARLLRALLNRPEVVALLDDVDTTNGPEDAA